MDAHNNGKSDGATWTGSLLFFLAWLW